MSEYKIPIPSRVYNAAVGGHVAGADQIIDDKTGLTLDKVAGGALEEKEHISGSNNGMGRVVLRKNLVEGVNTLTQSMINKSNTIYIIQYDFDLNGQEITIPEGCILDFKGGSLSNGTINGEFNIIANNTIFKNINGLIKTNVAYSYYCGTTSSDINKCLNLFECNEFKIIGNIEFNETIIIDKPISLIWENGSINANDNDKTVFIIYPIVKNVAMGTSTILYKNAERANPFIKLYGYKQEYDIHFIKYELPRIFNDANVYTQTLKGIGVELITNEECQYLYNSFIQIYCEKIDTALKIIWETGSTNITDNTFNIVSWDCTNGIIFDNTNKFGFDYNTVNLMFQSSPNVEKIIKLTNVEEVNSLSIFNISLWDSHYISHTDLIDKFRKATYNNNIKTLDKFCTFYTNKFDVSAYNKTYSKELLDSSLPCISDISVIRYCILKNITSEDSRENIIKKIIYNILTQFDYTIEIFIPYDNTGRAGCTPGFITSIINKVIYNNDIIIKNTANLKITVSGYGEYRNIDFEISGLDFIFHTLYTFNNTKNITDYNDINITNSESKYIGLRSESAPIYAFYDTAFLDTSIYKDSYYENHKFADSTEKDSLGRNQINYKYLQTCDLSGTKSHNRFVKGYMFFNTDKNKLMIYKGNGVWCDALGNE